MLIDYSALKATIANVVAGVKQGTILLLRATETPDSDYPWRADDKTTASTTLDAVATAVSKADINNETILATDTKVVCAAPTFEIDPSTDRISIDGELFEIKDMKRVPYAGLAIAYILFVRK